MSLRSVGQVDPRIRPADKALVHLNKFDPGARICIRPDVLFAGGDLKDAMVVLDNTQSSSSVWCEPINGQLHQVVEVGPVRSVLTGVVGAVRPDPKRKSD